MKDANALNRGLWLGLAGIVIFAATLPLTRLAVGTPEAPHMSSIFVALARAALAASLAGLYLLATRAPWPQRHEWRPLALGLDRRTAVRPGSNTNRRRDR